MDRIPMYRYLGTNGVITSTVHLEDVYYVRMVKLISDPDKLLTNDKTTTRSIVIPEEEETEWYEIPARA